MKIRQPIRYHPIRYRCADLGPMILGALHANPKLPRKIRESHARIRKMMCGSLHPSPAMLRYLELDDEGEGFVWQPRQPS